MIKQLWSDESGALLSVELILLIVITVIGISVGMVVLRDSIVTEFQSMAAAMNSIDTGFGFSGLEYVGLDTSGYVNGSLYDSSFETIGAGFINNEVVGDSSLVSNPKDFAEIISSP